jgi:hypothetical protein
MPQTQLSYSESDGKIFVTGTMPCGKTFDLATIHEPNSPNPGLEVPKPTGIRAIKQIIEHLEGAKEALGQ